MKRKHIQNAYTKYRVHAIPIDQVKASGIAYEKQHMHIAHQYSFADILK